LNSAGLGATRTSVRSAVVPTVVVVLLLPLLVGLGFLQSLIESFRWSEPAAADPEPGLELAWPEPPGPFRRMLVLILDGVHPRLAFDPKVCAAVSGAMARGRHGIAEVPYVAFTNTCIRTLFAGVGFDLLAAMKNFRPDKLGEDNLFRRVRRAGGSTGVVTDDILWELLFHGDLDQIVFEEPTHQAMPETGDLLVAANLARGWRETSHRLVVAHFAALDLLGHRLGTRHPAYRAHLRKVDAVVGEVLADLRPGELCVILSDHGQDARGGHAGGEPEGRESFFLFTSTDGRVAPGDAGRVRQQDLCAAMAVALGLPLPTGSEGEVHPDWFTVGAAARATWIDRNLRQLRAGPAAKVAADVSGPPLVLLEHARELTGARLKRRSFVLSVVAWLTALAGILVVRALHLGQAAGPGAHAALGAALLLLAAPFLPWPEAILATACACAGLSVWLLTSTLPRLRWPLAAALLACVLLERGGALLLGVDVSDLLSPWWVRGAFLASAALVVPWTLPWAARHRPRLDPWAPAVLLVVFWLLGLVPLTLRSGFYQLVVLGIAGTALLLGVLGLRHAPRARTLLLLGTGILLLAWVAQRLWVERAGSDVRLLPLGWPGVAEAAGALVATAATLWLARGRPQRLPYAWLADALGLLVLCGSYALHAAGHTQGPWFLAVLGASAVVLVLCWAPGSRTGIAPVAALLAVYRLIAFMDGEVILLCATLCALALLLRAAPLAGFGRVAFAAFLLLAWFTYTLYVLDEPLTFARLNVLIGDVAGGGARSFTATVLLVMAKYLLPLWLFLALLWRHAPGAALPVATLMAWALVLRLPGGILVVSHHPRNFGEVTRVIGEGVYASALFLFLLATALLVAVAPRRWREEPA
jgi:hypothetical protein